MSGINKKFNGTKYVLYDAFETKADARRFAKDTRTKRGRLHSQNMTLARVVDLGKNSGRQRWGVFIAMGERVKG